MSDSDAVVVFDQNVQTAVDFYSAPGPVGGCVGVCGCVCVRASVAHRCLPTVRRRVGHAVVAEEAAYYSTAVV